MSRPTSSPVENALGMLFTALCVAGILIYRLYKHIADKPQQEGSQQ